MWAICKGRDDFGGRGKNWGAAEDTAAFRLVPSQWSIAGARDGLTSVSCFLNSHFAFGLLSVFSQGIHFLSFVFLSQQRKGKDSTDAGSSPGLCFKLTVYTSLVTSALGRLHVLSIKTPIHSVLVED